METKAAVDRRDDDNFLKGIRDILLYLVFLVLYMVVAQQAAIAEAYPLSSKMKDEVLGGDAFNQILTTDDIWDYLETQFVDIAFIDEDDEGDRDQTPSGRWGYVLDVNRIIGAIQFRQKRVDVGGALPWNATPNCEVPQVFKKEIDKCYPSLASNGYASNPFGGTCGCDTVMTGVGNGVARVCATSPCDDSFFVSEDVRGERNPVFLYNLPINITAGAARARLQELRERHWIDLQTRELLVYLTVFNPAADLFCNAKLSIEILPSGGAEVSSSFKTVNLVRHLLTLTNAGAIFPPTSLDTVNLLVEAFFWLIAIALFLQTLALWHKTGIVKFFKSFWNLADLVNYSLFMAILGCRIYTLTLLNELDFQPPSNVFSDFHLTAIGLYQVSNLMAVTCVITWFKLLRFLQLSSRLSQLTNTIGAAAEDLGSFMLIFVVVYVAYAQAFFMAFGMDLEAYSTFDKSITSLMLIILGSFDFQGMKSANATMALLLFFSFVIFVFFILVNMFIAILGEAHSEVMGRDTEDDEFVKKMRAGWNRRLSALQRSKVKAPNGVQALARSLEAEEDATMPTVEEEGAFDETRQPAGGVDSEEEPGLAAFGVGVKRDLTQTKRRLKVMSLTEVMAAAQRADAATLLRALHEHTEESDESGAPGPIGGTGLGGRQRVVGLQNDLTTEMTARVEAIEKETATLKEWLEMNHKDTQEKIALLTEGTFAITNMLAGVQGVDPMKLLETTDRTVGIDELAGEVAVSDAERAALGAVGKAKAAAAQRSKAARSMTLAGAKAGSSGEAAKPKR